MKSLFNKLIRLYYSISFFEKGASAVEYAIFEDVGGHTQ